MNKRLQKSVEGHTSRRFCLWNATDVSRALGWCPKHFTGCFGLLTSLQSKKRHSPRYQVISACLMRSLNTTLAGSSGKMYAIPGIGTVKQ